MKRAQKSFTNRRYLDAIADHVVLFDGAMGTSIQARNPVAADFGGDRYEGCVDYLSVTRPDMIEAIHESFLAVGCEVVESSGRELMEEVERLTLERDELIEGGGSGLRSA